METAGREREQAIIDVRDPLILTFGVLTMSRALGPLLVLVILFPAAYAEAQVKVVRRANVAAWVEGPGVELGKKKAKQELEDLKLALRKAMAAKVDPRITETTTKNNTIIVPTREAKATMVETIRAKIEAAEMAEPRPGFPDLIPRALDVGMIGHIPGAFHVLQVLDERNLTAEIRESPQAPPVMIWIEMGTKDMADDAWYTSGELFEVAGTRRFDTLAGTTRTVFMLTPRKLEELLKP
jgi:hypothetical protein